MVKKRKGFAPVPMRTRSGSTGARGSAARYVRCRLAELGDAGREDSSAVACAQRRGRCLADMERRVEVGLTDLEMDDGA